MFLPFLSFAKPQKQTFGSFSFNPIILWSLPLLLPSRPSSLPLLLQSRLINRRSDTGAHQLARLPQHFLHRFRKRKIITCVDSVTCVDGFDGFNLCALIQLLPVILIILLQFLPSSDPIYALLRSYPYEYKFTTERGVNFYVKSSKFEQDYPLGSVQRVRLEKQVKKDYFTILIGVATVLLKSSSMKQAEAKLK
ncbi:hypothetical protein KPL70_017662 [Citrus sinensis]|nr:hypothetical protein KPL70_017662 [Citrus sinensis]